MVKFEPGIGMAGAQGSIRTEGLVPLEVIADSEVVRVQVPLGQELEIIAELMARGDVEIAEPNYIAYALDTFPNDVSYNQQWGLTKIGAPAAWDITTGGTNILIAVVDTGIDLSHPDFNCPGKLVPGANFVAPGSPPNDGNGHGTHVAGIAAACANNDIGVTGLAWGAQLMPVKVLSDGGTGGYDAVTKGIRYAADNGADIINLSLGSPAESQILSEAIQYAYDKGVLVIAAAGNCASGGWNCGNSINPVFYPAAYPNTLAVAATDVNDGHASFSEYHPYVDVAAPGVSIYSTWSGGGYARVSGTSMATPYVAGLAALIWSVDPNVSRDKLQSVIQSSADDLGSPGKDDYFGYGRINARSALTQIWSVDLEPVSPNCKDVSTVSFIIDDDEGPLPPNCRIRVKTDSQSSISWTVSTSPNVSWLKILPAGAAVSTNSKPGEFTMVTTRPNSYGTHTTTLTVTSHDAAGAPLGTAALTVNVIYSKEMYKVNLPLILK